MGVWDLEKRASIALIPSLGGYGYSIQLAPCQPATLAVGVGDQVSDMATVVPRGSCCCYCWCC